MQYLVAGRRGTDKISLDPRRIVAQGDAMVLEGPWPWAAPVVARLDDAAIEGVHASGIDGYFRPYVDGVGAVVERFGGRFLARSGRATVLGGDFVSDRAVIIEFPHAADAVAFYAADEDPPRHLRPALPRHGAFRAVAGRGARDGRELLARAGRFVALKGA
jgi:uncharacterized protein (DUF1330 family)